MTQQLRTQLETRGEDWLVSLPASCLQSLKPDGVCRAVAWWGRSHRKGQGVQRVPSPQPVRGQSKEELSTSTMCPCP